MIIINSLKFLLDSLAQFVVKFEYHYHCPLRIVIPHFQISLTTLKTAIYSQPQNSIIIVVLQIPNFLHASMCIIVGFPITKFLFQHLHFQN